MKSLLEYGEESLKRFLDPGKNRIQSVLNSHEELQKIGQFFSSIHPFPTHLQTKMIDSTFCSLQGLFLTKLNRYFNVPINTNKFFRYSK